MTQFALAYSEQYDRDYAELLETVPAIGSETLRSFDRRAAYAHGS
jgi:hypothetical protein